MYQALLAYFVLCDTSQIVYDENLMRRMAELVKAGTFCEERGVEIQSAKYGNTSQVRTGEQITNLLKK